MSKGRKRGLNNGISKKRREPSAWEDSRLLIDDVYTTGSSAEICTEALRAAGATEVFVLTALKTQPDWVDDEPIENESDWREFQ